MPEVVDLKAADLSNEGVSLLENAAHLGLPVPDAIKKVLEQLHDRSDGKEEQ